MEKAKMDSATSKKTSPKRTTVPRMRTRDEIESKLQGGFESELFGAALANLGALGNPLRFNDFAYAARELLRVVLARLAPDSEVRQCVWYSNETGDPAKISRTERVRYAIQGGLACDYVSRILNIDLRPTYDALRDVVSNLSKHTHIEKETFDIPSVEVDRYVEDVLSALMRLLDVIDETRGALISNLREHIDQAAVDSALAETIQEIDELATHHYIDEVYTAEVSVIGIDSRNVFFEATGTVSCELQWGSNSDLRNGDGALLAEAFPRGVPLYLHAIEYRR